MGNQNSKTFATPRMHRNVSCCFMLLVLLLSVTAAVAPSCAAKQQRNNHTVVVRTSNNKAGEPDPANCSSNFMPPSLCATWGRQCPWQAPYLCLAGDGSTKGCFTPQQAPSQICAVCYNVQLCAATSCSSQCPPEFCSYAYSKSWACPGVGRPVNEIFVASSGAAAGYCGVYSAMLQNPTITACCNFVQSCTLAMKGCDKSCSSDTCDTGERRAPMCDAGNRFVVAASFDGDMWCGKNISVLGSPDNTYLLSNPDVRSCCDSKTCMVQSCLSQCSKAFCVKATEHGWACNPQFPKWIVSKSDSMEGWCGSNTECADKVTCLVNNWAVTECCDITSCTSPPGASCAAAPCPPYVCGTSQCYAPYVYNCIAGGSRGGCSSIPTHWSTPGQQCNACCDVSTCWLKCSNTPCSAEVQSTLCQSCPVGSGDYVCSAGSGGAVGACTSNATNVERNPACTACCKCAI